MTARQAVALGATVALLAAAVLLAACGVPTGWIVGKGHDDATDYPCQISTVQVGNVSVPMYGTCEAPECWRLDLADTIDGEADAHPCVDPAVWQRVAVGQRYGVAS